MRFAVYKGPVIASKHGESITTRFDHIAPLGKWLRTNSGYCITMKTARLLIYDWCTQWGKVIKTEAAKSRKQRRTLKQLHLELRALGYERATTRAQPSLNAGRWINWKGEIL